MTKRTTVIPSRFSPGPVACAGIVATLLWIAPAKLFAGMDTPGTLSFEWLAEEEQIYNSLEEIPADAPFADGTANAFFSSDASAFGDQGVLIWSGIQLESAQGARYGILELDIDLANAPLDGKTPLPHEQIKAEYLEKQGDEVKFWGTPVSGEVWIVDLFLHQKKEGGVEGNFVMIFTDPSGKYPGCRVLRKSHFITDPSPARLRRDHGITSEQPTDKVYTDTGCSGDVVVADNSNGCDCGGSDQSSGCEGDSSGSSAGGCGGSSGGCEGDTGGGDCSGGGGGDCAGGGGGSCGGGGCEEKAHAAVGMQRHNGGPLQALTRLFPEISVLSFVVWMKRRNRRKGK